MSFSEYSRMATMSAELPSMVVTVLPLMDSTAPTWEGYRNKAQYPVSVQKGRAYAGFFRAGTHTVVENSRCRILPEETDRVKDIVIDYVSKQRNSSIENDFLKTKPTKSSTPGVDKSV